jgi:hypothetical protein
MIKKIATELLDVTFTTIGLGIKKAINFLRQTKRKLPFAVVYAQLQTILVDDTTLSLRMAFYWNLNA